MISEICRRLILKVRILKTAKDQKYFEVVCIKNLLPYDLLIDLPYTRHYNPLLIIYRSWILTIHKAKGHST